MRKTQAEEGDGEEKASNQSRVSFDRRRLSLSLSTSTSSTHPSSPPPHKHTHFQKTAIGRVCEKCELIDCLESAKKREKERVREEEEEQHSSSPSLKKKTPNLKKKNRRRQVRRLRLVRAPRHARPHLRRVQLRQPVRPLRRLWGLRRGGRLLLPGVHSAGEGREEEKFFSFKFFFPIFFFRFFVLSFLLTTKNSLRAHSKHDPKKQRDGCPKVINLGVAKTDAYFERKRRAGGGGG
mgnify:CR=1 FL=1